MKKAFALLLILTLAGVQLAACGSKPQTPAATARPGESTNAPAATEQPAPTEQPTEEPQAASGAGKYLLETVDFGDMQIEGQETLEQIGYGGFYIELRGDGGMEINTSEVLTGTWTPGRLSYRENGENVSNDFVLEDNVLSIELGDSETGFTTLRFRLEGTVPAPTPKPELNAEEAALTGEYICTGWIWDGEDYSPEGEWLILSDDLTGTYFEVSEEEAVKWSAADGVITLDSTLLGTSYTGVIEDGKIIMDAFLDDSIKLVFERGSIEDRLAAQVHVRRVNYAFVANKELSVCREFCVVSAVVGIVLWQRRQTFAYGGRA